MNPLSARPFGAILADPPWKGWSEVAPPTGITR